LIDALIIHFVVRIVAEPYFNLDNINFQVSLQKLYANFSWYQAVKRTQNNDDNLNSGAAVQHFDVDYCNYRHLWSMALLVNVGNTSQLITASMNNFGTVTECYSSQLDSCPGPLALNNNQGIFDTFLF
jgi:hypothetical protein